MQCSEEYVIRSVYSCVYFTDYETTATYDLTLIATDLGNPPKHCELTLSIIVINDNEYGPVFNKPVSTPLLLLSLKL